MFLLTTVNYHCSDPLWVLFLINFIGVIFEAGNETREKIWSNFGAEQKLRAERKESGFCSYRCF